MKQQKTSLQKLIDYMEENYHLTDESRHEFKKALEEDAQDKANTKEILKELIEEMELRVVSFEYNRDLYEEVDAQHGYWDGKRSESAFMVEKLKWIFEQNNNTNTNTNKNKFQERLSQMSAERLKNK